MEIGLENLYVDTGAQRVKDPWQNLYKVEDPHEILEEPLKIPVFKDLCRIFADPQRSCKDFHPGITVISMHGV